MSWLHKIAQPNLRPEFPRWGTPTCPRCSYLIFEPEKYDRCPGCGRDTSDLPKRAYACPDCGTRITTGKVGDCTHCGYDWTQRAVDMNSKMEEIFYPKQSGLATADFLRAARDLGGQTVEDLTKLSYDKILNTARENFKRNYPQNPYWHVRWHVFFPIFHLSEEDVILPEQLKKWIEYIKYEYDNDQERITYQKKEEEESQQMTEEEKQKEKEKEKKAKILAQRLLDANLEGWEDTTFEQAYQTALSYLNEHPSKRSLWRKSIRDLAADLFAREFPVKHYYMEPKEAEEYLKKSQELIEKSGGIEFVPNETLTDIINKTVGITDSKDLWFGRNWGNVHPGYSATWVLNPANSLKYDAANELRKRLEVAKDDKPKLQEIYFLLDEDNRDLFFKKIE